MIIHQNIHLLTASTAGEEMATGLQHKLSMPFNFKMVVKIAFWSFFYVYSLLIWEQLFTKMQRNAEQKTGGVSFAVRKNKLFLMRNKQMPIKEIQNQDDKKSSKSRSSQNLASRIQLLSLPLSLLRNITFCWQ